jgi:hypothetical protein
MEVETGAVREVRDVGDVREMQEPGPVPPRSLSGGDESGRTGRTDRLFGREGGWRAWLWEGNPFFLISVALMLAGCWLIRGELAGRREDVAAAAALLAVFNAYEAAVIGLGLYLARRLPRRRVGWELLALEAVLASDAVLLHQLIAQHDVATGAAVAAGAWLLAALKAAAVIRGLRLSFTAGEAAFAAGSAGLLLGWPVAAEAMAAADAMTSASAMLGWWAAGGLVAAAPWPALSRAWGTLGRTSEGRRVWTVHAAVAAAPFLSALLHLRASHWTYELPTGWPMVSPLLLGLAVAATRCGAGMWSQRRLAATQALLLAAAVAASNSSLPGAAFALPGTEEIVSPLRLTLTASAAVALWGYGLTRRDAFAFASAAALLAAAAGHTPAAMAETLRRLAPTTPAGWGVAAVAGAFAMLVFGARAAVRDGGEGGVAPDTPAAADPGR